MPQVLNDLLGNALAFVFALGIVISIHEAGHLLVAKLFDVRVHAFSIGFGPRIWGFRRGETDYRLSLVPLGGYVKLGGEQPDEVSGDPRDFLSKPRWQRILVYLAGPAANVLLAILLIAVVFMVGAEIPNLRVPAEIGSVVEGSTAAGAGVQPGDRIVAVNGQPVRTWSQVGLELVTSADRPVALTLERGDERLGVTVVPQKLPDDSMGDLAGLVPKLLPTVTKVEAVSPAAEAGLQAGDQLRRVDGKPVLSVDDFISYVSDRSGETIVLEVMRGSRLVEVPVVPREDGGIGRIGVGLGVFQRYGFFESFVQSARFNRMLVGETFNVLGKIFSREVSAKSALAGPIEIAKYSGAAARVGFKHLLYLTGFISISIAIVNLLPIPILDGGQIVILGVESVMRRDLSMRLKEVIAQVGFVLIMLLMLTVIYFDLSKNLPAGLLPGS